MKSKRITIRFTVEEARQLRLAIEESRNGYADNEGMDEQDALLASADASILKALRAEANQP